MANPSHHDRVARERDFHNDIYACAGSRDDQAKYYWALSDGMTDYECTYERLARGKDVLVYGCGDTRNFLTLAPSVESISAIDISDHAIEQLRLADIPDNVSLDVMDAMDMTFVDNSFDVVFGAGIIHHLETEAAARELARVLRPGGRAVFWEPLGLNPLINVYRRLTPDARSPDEHPLVPRDFRAMAEYLDLLELRHYGMTTLAAVPLRNTKAGSAALRLGRRIDRALFRLPAVKNLAWYVLFVCTTK